MDLFHNFVGSHYQALLSQKSSHNDDFLGQKSCRVIMKFSGPRNHHFWTISGAKNRHLYLDIEFQFLKLFFTFEKSRRHRRSSLPGSHNAHEKDGHSSPSHLYFIVGQAPLFVAGQGWAPTH